MLLLTGAGMMAYGVLPLPSWARQRGRQMEAITTALALSEAEPTPKRLP
jgi:hypothetical protein